VLPIPEQLFDPQKEDHRNVLSTLHQLQYAFRHPVSIEAATPLSRIAVSRFFGRLIDAAENRLMARVREADPCEAAPSRLGTDLSGPDLLAAFNFDAIVGRFPKGTLS